MTRAGNRRANGAGNRRANGAGIGRTEGGHLGRVERPGLPDDGPARRPVPAFTQALIGFLLCGGLLTLLSLLLVD